MSQSHHTTLRYQIFCIFFHSKCVSSIPQSVINTRSVSRLQILIAQHQLCVSAISSLQNSQLHCFLMFQVKVPWNDEKDNIRHILNVLFIPFLTDQRVHPPLYYVQKLPTMSLYNFPFHIGFIFRTLYRSCLPPSSKTHSITKSCFCLLYTSRCV